MGHTEKSRYWSLVNIALYTICQTKNEINMKHVLFCLMLICIVIDNVTADDFSGKLENNAVMEVCCAVTRWQAEHHDECQHHDLDWTNGALYRGIIEWSKTSGDTLGIGFVKSICEKNGWSLLDRVYHADDICIGQAYIELFRLYQDKRMIQQLMERAFYVSSHPSVAVLSKKDKRGKDERWSWCDALFMAPPVYAALYEMTGEKTYVEYMDREFRICTDSLFDYNENLYYRDCIRIPLREPNGQKQFWARGNGWVFAGIPLILENLPENHPTRFYYVDLFKKMASKIASLQDSRGAWHASLLDPVTYPFPENSASAFFCYGFAWGINNGLLAVEEYSRVLEKGWASLVSCVSQDGKLGYIQPVGAAPASVGMESTDVYGIGAFLLAGSEILRFVR